MRRGKGFGIPAHDDGLRFGRVHMSIPKAADILGFGRDQVRVVACDDHQRMRVDSLRQKIEADVREGLKTFFASLPVRAL